MNKFYSKSGNCIPSKNDMSPITPPVQVPPKIPLKYASKYDDAPVWTDEPEAAITPFAMQDELYQPKEAWTPIPPANPEPPESEPTTSESNPLSRIVVTVRDALARLEHRADESTLWDAAQALQNAASELRCSAREAADREQHGDEQ